MLLLLSAIATMFCIIGYGGSGKAVNIIDLKFGIPLSQESKVSKSDTIITRSYIMHEVMYSPISVIPMTVTLSQFPGIEMLTRNGWHS